MITFDNILARWKAIAQAKGYKATDDELFAWASDWEDLYQQFGWAIGEEYFWDRVEDFIDERRAKHGNKRRNSRK